MEQDDRRDAGFTLVEVIVASVLFVVLGTAAAVALSGAVRASMTSEGRTQATNIAAEHVELARSADPGNLTNANYTEQRGGLKYYVTRTIALGTVGEGSVCDGASGAEALRRITVTVRWDGMGNIAPVRSDTQRSMPVAGADTTRGTLTFKVVDRTGAPRQGAPVVLQRAGSHVASATTGPEGCVVFSGLPVGTDYVGSLSQSGHVDERHRANPGQATNVVGGQVTKNTPFVWEQASRPVVTADAPAGYPVPQGVPLTVFDASASGGAVLSSCAVSTPCATMSGAGTTRARWDVQGLFPALQGFRVAGGACSSCTASPRDVTTNIKPQPGQAVAFAAPDFGGVSVLVRRGGAYVPSTVWAVNASDRRERYQFPATTGTSSAQAARLALPAGNWQLSVSPDEGRSGYSVLVPVAPGGVSPLQEVAAP